MNIDCSIPSLARWRSDSKISQMPMTRSEIMFFSSADSFHFFVCNYWQSTNWWMGLLLAEYSGHFLDINGMLNFCNLMMSLTTEIYCDFMLCSL